MLRVIPAISQRVANPRRQRLRNGRCITGPHLPHNGQLHREVLIHRRDRHPGLSRNLTHGDVFISTRGKEAECGFEHGFKASLTAFLSRYPLYESPVLHLKHRCPPPVFHLFTAMRLVQLDLKPVYCSDTDHTLSCFEKKRGRSNRKWHLDVAFLSIGRFRACSTTFKRQSSPV